MLSTVESHQEQCEQVSFACLLILFAVIALISSGCFLPSAFPAAGKRGGYPNKALKWLSKPGLQPVNQSPSAEGGQLCGNQNSIYDLRSSFILQTSNMYFACFPVAKGWKSHSEWLACLWTDGVKCYLCEPMKQPRNSPALLSRAPHPAKPVQCADQSQIFSFMTFLLEFFFLSSTFFFHNQSLDSFFFLIQARDQTGQTSASLFLK